MKKIIFFFVIIVFAAASMQAQTQVTFYTSMGKFVIELYDTQRPITTKNFISLVNKKFYDKVTFHRVIDGFMIQGGDPTGTGSGGSGVKIKDEFTPKLSNVQKTIAMANSGPNTGTSQFFINLVNNTGLDTKHPVFGIVISNFAVVQAIGKVPTKSEKPVTPVIMDSVRITTNIPSGIEQELNMEESLTIFPNPVTMESSVSIHSVQEKIVSIDVYNQQGQLLGTVEKKILSGVNIVPFKEIAGLKLSSGMYYLMVSDGKTISREKFSCLNE